MRLAGKVAIISGAASGMGAATARMFAREGAKVVIADVLEHEGQQVTGAIGASARFEPLDVQHLAPQSLGGVRPAGNLGEIAAVPAERDRRVVPIVCQAAEKEGGHL